MTYATAPDGARIAYQLRGRGAPLVLLAGQANNHHWWDAVRADFHAARSTLTLDYRGTGDSDKPDTPHSTELSAQDVITVLDELGIDRADVYGTSMGGRVAQQLAARHPQRNGRPAQPHRQRTPPRRPHPRRPAPPRPRSPARLLRGIPHPRHPPRPGLPHHHAPAVRTPQPPIQPASLPRPAGDTRATRVRTDRRRAGQWGTCARSRGSLTKVSRPDGQPYLYRRALDARLRRGDGDAAGS
jgi:pimeloyl-ACP methyl ester carboxylesterase